MTCLKFDLMLVQVNKLCVLFVVPSWSPELKLWLTLASW